MLLACCSHITLFFWYKKSLMINYFFGYLVSRRDTNIEFDFNQNRNLTWHYCTGNCCSNRVLKRMLISIRAVSLFNGQVIFYGYFGPSAFVDLNQRSFLRALNVQAVV